MTKTAFILYFVFFHLWLCFSKKIYHISSKITISAPAPFEVTFEVILDDLRRCLTIFTSSAKKGPGNLIITRKYSVYKASEACLNHRYYFD